VGVAVIENAELGRYEIRSDGELAGFVTYRRHPGLIEFVHTEIDKRFEGHGLASQLSRSVLDTARADGLQVLPVCPFVRAFIREHHDYLDLVPAGRRAGFDLPEA
jgi:predicted GNAT family acetyltransferase